MRRNPLKGTLTLLLLIAAVFMALPAQSNVLRVDIGARRFLQVAGSDDVYAFTFFILGENLSAAILTPPTGSTAPAPIPLDAADEDPACGTGQTCFYLNEEYASEATRDAAWPVGTYSIEVTDNSSGLQTAQIEWVAGEPQSPGSNTLVIIKSPGNNAFLRPTELDFELYNDCDPCLASGYDATLDKVVSLTETEQVETTEILGLSNDVNNPTELSYLPRDVEQLVVYHFTASAYNLAAGQAEFEFSPGGGAVLPAATYTLFEDLGNQISFMPVPEPGVFLLVGTALAGVAVIRRLSLK